MSVTESQKVIRARAVKLAATNRQLLQNLKKQRQATGLSQEEVAERMDISQSAVAQFERYDSNPTLNTIMRYALAVGADIKVQVLDDTVCSDYRETYSSERVATEAISSETTGFGVALEWETVAARVPSNEEWLSC